MRGGLEFMPIYRENELADSPLTELPPSPLPLLALHPVLVNLYQLRMLIF